MIRTVWQCDGCDKEPLRNGRPDDWHEITVTFAGFTGYPVGADANTTTQFVLCPSCQKRLVDVAYPTHWARGEVCPK